MKMLDVTDTPIDGLKLVGRERFEDDRGFLSRIFCAEDLAAAGWTSTIAQINHTRTRGKGAVRGMHYQMPPHAEMKLVTCFRGKIWDVAVDIRSGSPTFLRWHAEILSEDNYRSLLIPEGFAHGFQVLTEDVEMLYLHSSSYHRESEGGLNPLDERLGIDWPLPVSLLSERDKSHAAISEGFEGVRL